MTSGPVLIGVISHTQPHQIERLVRQLVDGHPDVEVVIHHDRSATDQLRPDWAVERTSLLVRRRALSWGDGQDVDVLRDLIEVAIARDAEWFVLISGQDYPAAPVSSLVSHLRTVEADACLDLKVPGDPAGWGPGEATGRYAYAHVRVDQLPFAGVLRRAAARLPTPGSSPDGRSAVEPGVSAPPVIRMAVGDALFLGVRRRAGRLRRTPLRYGAQWFAMTGAAARKIARLDAAHPDFARQMARSILPDEAWLQTLVNLAGLRTSGWLHAVEFEGPRATVVTMRSLPGLLAQRPFFLRKVDEQREPGVLDALDQIIAAGPAS